MRIHISGVGAFDRFNYGDILFAKILEHMVSESTLDAEVEFFSLISKDLTAYGGVKTSPLKYLYRKNLGHDEKHIVVLTGGELLSPTWSQMAEHLVPARVSLQLKRLHKRTGPSNWARFWRSVYGCPNLQPWTLDPEQFAKPENTHVLYNAVGGTNTAALSPEELKWQNDALSRAHWISVRDHFVANTFKERGMPIPQIVPDSAVVMNELQSLSRLRRLGHDVLEQAGVSNGPYVCVQIAERWLRGMEAELIADLRKIHEHTGFNIVSFPIGRASGHDDHISCQKLKALLVNEPWFFIIERSMTVNETMALISGSACYVGSSLHGFITAFAFETPRVGLFSHLKKLVGFRDAWDLPDMPAGIEIGAIPQAVGKALKTDKCDMRDKSQTAKKLYKESFSEMMGQVSLALP